MFQEVEEPICLKLAYTNHNYALEYIKYDIFVHFCGSVLKYLNVPLI